MKYYTGVPVTNDISIAPAESSARGSVKTDDASIVLHNIYTRRSVRSYQPDAIPDEVLREIIKAGTYAPTAVNMQPWRFVVIKGKERIQRYGEIARRLWLEKNGDATNEHLKDLTRMMANENFKVFYGAPALILVFADPSAFSPVQDCSLAAENMMLAGKALGLGSCWIGLATTLGSDEEFLKEIGVTPDYKLVAPLVFGYPKKENLKSPDRKSDVILKWLNDA